MKRNTHRHSDWYYYFLEIRVMDVIGELGISLK